MRARRPLPKTGRAKARVVAKTRGRAKTRPEDRSGEDARRREDTWEGEDTSRRQVGEHASLRRHFPKTCRSVEDTRRREETWACVRLQVLPVVTSCMQVHAKCCSRWRSYTGVASTRLPLAGRASAREPTVSAMTSETCRCIVFVTSPRGVQTWCRSLTCGASCPPGVSVKTHLASHLSQPGSLTPCRQVKPRFDATAGDAIWRPDASGPVTPRFDATSGDVASKRGVTFLRQGATWRRQMWRQNVASLAIFTPVA